MWSRLRLALPLVLAACVRPDENLIKIICGDGQPPCPEGKSCVAGFCAGAVDAAVTDDAATDASMTTDQANSMPDLRPVQGCASGTGVALGAMASACPGHSLPGRLGRGALQGGHYVRRHQRLTWPLLRVCKASSPPISLPIGVERRTSKPAAPLLAINSCTA